MVHIRETWKDIDGYEGYYQISSLGRVKSLERVTVTGRLMEEKLKEPWVDDNGYLNVHLYKEGKRKHFRIHRLVAQAFVPNPRNLDEVDHKDTDRKNNRAKNLRWVTHSENHMNELTRKRKSEAQKGKKKKRKKKDPKDCRIKVAVYKDRKLVHTFDSYADLTNNSEAILGEKIWARFARQVVRGDRKDFKGYKFRIIENK